MPPQPDRTSGGEVVGWGYKTAWLAVKTENMEEVVRAVGLREPRWLPWAEAVDLAYSIDRESESRPLLVTPPIRGWVLVMSKSLLDRQFGGDQDMADIFHAFLSRLSERFGEAQFFGSYRVVGAAVWGRWLNGRCRRLLSFSDEGLEQYGDIDGPAEAALFDREKGANEAGCMSFDEEDVLAVAAEWSLDPREFDDPDQRLTEAGHLLTGRLPRRAWPTE